MRDPDHLTQGNDALSGSAEDPAAGSTGDSSRLVEPIARAVVASAAGTTVNPLDRSSYAVATNAGYGNAMGRGLELALTLAVFGAIGWFADRVVGTSPLFTIIFSVVGFAGIGVKLKLGYDLEMRSHEDGAIWNRTPGDGTGPVAS